MRFLYSFSGLLFIFLLAVSSCASAQQFWAKNSFFARKGCKYTPGKIFIDTVATIDPATGMEIFEAREDPSYPLAINGNRIYDIDEVDTPVQVEDQQLSLDEYMLERLKPLLNASRFNEYAASVRLNLRGIVIDEHGKVVFYEYYGLKGITAENRVKKLTPMEFPEKLNKFMSELPLMKPAMVGGKNVMSYSGIDLHHYKIEKYQDELTYSYDGAIYGD